MTCTSSGIGASAGTNVLSPYIMLQLYGRHFHLLVRSLRAKDTSQGQSIRGFSS